MAAHFPLDRGSDVPLHRQIYDGLRRAIVGGSLRPGQRVPSTRALADELSVSRFPVLAAYDQLLHEGYLTGRSGAGTFVSATLPDDAFRPAQPRGAPSARVPAVRPPTIARDEGGLTPFRMSLPGLDHFPHAEWTRLVVRHARELPPAMMAYGDPAGLQTLRTAVAEHLRAARAVRCEADQVLVVSGSQAGLRISASAILRPGDAIAVEEPGYPGAHAALASSGARLVPVMVDQEGLSVAGLEALRDPPRAVYVTPSHQYPLGVSMSAARRGELLEWAGRHDAWVLEDDYDSEYRYVSRPLASLQGMDPRGRVIYIGSFSKVLFPSLRVGYLVVPPSLRERFVEARESLDIFSPTLYQLVLADFLREGHFARHLRRMRTVYGRRRDALLAGLAEHCAGTLAVLNADAGLHISTRLPPGVDDVATIARLRARGLTASPLSQCYAGEPSSTGLLLGFGGFDERRLKEAAAVLGEVLRQRA